MTPYRAEHQRDLEDAETLRQLARDVPGLGSAIPDRVRPCRRCSSPLFPLGCLLDDGHEGNHVLRFGDVDATRKSVRDAFVNGSQEWHLTTDLRQTLCNRPVQAVARGDVTLPKCSACHATRNRVQERLKWWRTDLAYKAPELIDGHYVWTLLNDLDRAADV